jgi:hypothetical protein
MRWVFDGLVASQSPTDDRAVGYASCIHALVRYAVAGHR